MFWFTMFRTVLRSLVANKLRSGLTILGIMIGVGAVIATVSVGAGTQDSVQNSLSKMGTNRIYIYPGASQVRHVSGGLAQTLTLRDLNDIRRFCPLVELAAPIIFNSSQVKYYNKNINTTVIGTEAEFFKIANFELEEGDLFSPEDLAQSRKVVILGKDASLKLFGEGTPVDKTIKIQGSGYTVIGVLKAKGYADDQIFVPFNTAANKLVGHDWLQSIEVSAVSMEDISSAIDQITFLLCRNHCLKPPAGADPTDYSKVEREKYNFSIMGQNEIMENAKGITSTLTYLLASAAAISLLVGGIGIMNTTLISVLERTREIGIRMAVGAQRFDILIQFMLEALIMSAVGGLLGLLLGLGGSHAIAYFMQWNTLIPIHAYCISLSFALLIGLVFGIFPAYKASRLDPIEALRYE